MSDILGLPVHPLVVHAVVVLVPLLAIGMVLATVSRRWAERLSLVLGVLAVAAAGSAVIARWSGQSLLARVPGSAEVARHAGVADALAWLVVLVAVLTVGWAWQLHRGRQARVWGVTATVAAVVATAWTVLAGHSGAEAVWGDLG